VGKPGAAHSRSAVARAARDAAQGEAPTALDPRSAAFDRAFDRAFGLIAFAMNRHLIDHMLRAQRELQVDFESIVIWGLLAHLNAAHLVPPGSSPASLLDQRGRVKAVGAGLRPLRLRDLEQISRMPRETIRRKLALLEAKGYVERSGQGWIYRSASVDARLIEFNRETARRMLGAAEVVSRLLKDGLAAAEGTNTAPGHEPRGGLNEA
jgi:hypothetical protein